MTFVRTPSGLMIPHYQRGMFAMGPGFFQPSAAAPAVPTEVQAGGTWPSAASSSFAVALANNTVPGNILLMAMACSVGPTVITPSGGGWTSWPNGLVSVGQPPTGTALQVWTKVVTSAADGAFTVTTDSSVPAAIMVYELSGLTSDIAAPFVNTAPGTGGTYAYTLPAGNAGAIAVPIFVNGRASPSSASVAPPGFESSVYVIGGSGTKSIGLLLGPHETPATSAAFTSTITVSGVGYNPIAGWLYLKPKP